MHQLIRLWALNFKAVSLFNIIGAKISEAWSSCRSLANNRFVVSPWGSIQNFFFDISLSLLFDWWRFLRRTNWSITLIWDLLWFELALGFMNDVRVALRTFILDLHLLQLRRIRLAWMRWLPDVQINIDIHLIFASTDVCLELSSTKAMLKTKSFKLLVRPRRNEDLELCIIENSHYLLDEVIREHFVKAKNMRGIIHPNMELLKAGNISQLKVDKFTPFGCFMLL